MLEAQRLSREKLLAETTLAALDLTDLDAGVLLVNLLDQQGRCDEARSVAEEQIAYWERQATSVGSTDMRDSGITGYLA